MSGKVTVIDYGIGNLFSIANALRHCSADMELTGDPAAVAGADRLILPGVGAFRDGMDGLHRRGLAEAISAFIARERPFLGICLGMQMMLDRSEEFGLYEGLGLIPGSAVRIEATGAEGRPHKIPHIGWSELARSGRPWEGTLLEGISEGECAYFVHSYTAVPDGEEYRLADTFYDGRRLSAVIARGHVYGTQFHPEKSGAYGLKMLNTFLGL